MHEEKLTTCSMCLRVLRGADWIEVEQAISELRSFVLLVAPRLEAALCPRCTELLHRRRAQGQAQEPIAA
jgi:hypothetical protein